MKKSILPLIILVVIALSSPVNAAFYVAGSFNGWDSAGQLMTDNLDGTYSAVVTGLTTGVGYMFKVTDGTWATAYPGADSWFTADGSEVTITFNENILSDGWEPAQYRVGVSTDPGSWTFVGDLNGWVEGDPATEMTSVGNGIYKYSHTVATAGTYGWKAVRTGTWDAIGSDGRTVNAGDMSVTTTLDNEVVDFYVDAFSGTVGTGLNIVRIDRPHDPDPNHLSQDVQVAGLELSWTVAQLPSVADPNILVVDPNLVSHKIYINDGITTDPNTLVYVDTIVGWDAETLRASYTPSPSLNMDGHYLWRVDMVYADAKETEGNVWAFDTQLSIPIITAGPDYQVVDAAATANFEVTVSSVSTVTYQWYQYVDGISDLALSDAGDISGAETDSLSIANVELADEGGYYCKVNNDSGIPVQSVQGLLGVKRKIAHWDFESGNADSTVAGSPVSLLYGDPDFVTTGIVGDAMEFDDDADAEDLLYTDPDEASYFDICDYSMTVACWIKSSFAATWGPMVARNGEDNGWQLRHRGDTLDRICFTTRGTGNDDGTASNRTVYDGNWHYAVATYDGTVKKVYIDGVLSRVYSGDDGSVAQESDAASGLINSSLSPVALAGRVKGDALELDFTDINVTPCILDEVEIYNYALDGAVIAQTYADISGTTVCPSDLAYDLNGDCTIDLNDVALLASVWLTDIRVQPTP